MPGDRDGAPGGLFEEGRRAWPGIPLDRARFDAFVAARSSEAGAQLHGADLYLVCAAAHGDASALAAIDGRYVTPVLARLPGSKKSPTFADEVRQELCQRLFVHKKIELYTGRGPFASWLRVVAVRVASSLRAKDHPAVALADAVPDTGVDPELRLIRRRYGDAFRDALRDTLEALSPEERTLLRLYYMDRVTLEKLAGVLQSSRATMARRLDALRDRILVETQRLLRERLHATPTELASLLRVVRDDLGVSVSRILHESG